MDIKNYPNPFSSFTNIGFTVNEKTDVLIQIFGYTGRRVATLMDENVDAGNYSITWDARDFNGNKISRGTYKYRIIAGNSVITNKMITIE